MPRYLTPKKDYTPAIEDVISVLEETFVGSKLKGGI
jgi:hypothetical protein